MKLTILSGLPELDILMKKCGASSDMEVDNVRVLLTFW